MQEEGIWADLVSDGNVRAARLRWMQPWLISIGIAFIILGFYVGNLTATASNNLTARTVTTTLASRGGLEDQVETARAPVQAAVDGLPALRLAPAAIKGLPPASAIATDVLPAVRDALAKGVDPHDLDTVHVSPAAFWRQEWPGGKLVMTGDDKVRLVGALVAQGSEYYAVPRRWIGVFRRTGSDWEYATAQGAGLVDVEGQPSTPLTAIPLTLAPVLPATGGQ